ncbi:bone morphogenetic protein 1-like [Saccoglossus kowalevskii]
MSTESWEGNSSNNGCHQNLIVPSGGEINITSPEYPDFYPNKHSCTWHVRTEDLEDHIKIELLFFETEERFDYLWVGNPDSTPQEMNTTFLYHSGNSILEPLIVESPVLIAFKSDNSFQYHGFVILLSATLLDFMIPVYNCSRELTIDDTENIIITSPSYPELYPILVTCMWAISTENTECNIQVDFQSFETERDYDILWIGDVYSTPGDNECAIVTRSGSDIPDTLITVSPIHIMFNSDSSIHGGGFELRLTSTKLGNTLRNVTQMFSIFHNRQLPVNIHASNRP